MNVGAALLLTGLFALCVLLAWVNFGSDKHDEDD